MEIRIRFSSEVYLNGDNLNEIREKWESLPIFSADALETGYAEVIGVDAVEDSTTNAEIKNFSDYF